MTGSEQMAHCIKDAYRSLVLNSAGEKITIAQICDKAAVSRRTFYAYFNGKSDLVDAIFYDDALRGVEELLPHFLAKKNPDVSVPLFTEMVFRGIYDNGAFYRCLVAGGGATAFAEIISRNSTRLYRHLSTLDHVTVDEKLSYAFCFSGAGLAAIVVKWIQDGMAVPPETLATWLEEWGFSVAEVGFRLEKE